MKEYFDVVNENDKVIGRALRSTCHSNPKLFHRAVFVLVIRSDGKFLLQRRSSTKDTNPGKWEFLGEHNHLGEMYADAAVRGLKEELGIRAKVRKISKFRFTTKRETEFCEIFITSIGPATKINFDPLEISEVKFFTMSEIEKLIRTKKRSLTSWSIRVFDEYKRTK
jgi:isopentenyl-diphosphate delta-isomerase type 1